MRIVSILEQVVTWFIFISMSLVYYPGLNIQTVPWIGFSLLAFIGAMEVTTDVRKIKKGRKGK